MIKDRFTRLVSILDLLRGILFALIGAYTLLTVIYFFGQTVFQGFDSGTWQLIGFGAALGDTQIVFPPGFLGSVFSTIWGAPYVVVAAIIGCGLLWQSRDIIEYIRSYIRS